jgi:SAM-dependent methyltransferase
VQRLHLGCGRTILPGWINLDFVPGPGVDLVADLDNCAKAPLPFENDSVDEILGSHLLEHIDNSLDLMQELHRIAKPGVKAVFHMPYGSSDDAYEDPTHVRCYFLNSFAYFSQPAYWRADYGYRGDWQPEVIRLKISKTRYQGKTAEQVMEDVTYLRNVVLEMTAELVAVKPIRSPIAALLRAPNIELQLAEIELAQPHQGTGT